MPAIVGANHDRFTIKSSLADLNYVVPVPTSAEFVDAVLDIVARERINSIIGTDENVVKALSNSRDRFPFDLFLPSRETIDLCQDKHALNVFFRDRDIPVPQFYEVRYPSTTSREFSPVSRATGSYGAASAEGLCHWGRRPSRTSIRPAPGSRSGGICAE